MKRIIWVLEYYTPSTKKWALSYTIGRCVFLSRSDAREQIAEDKKNYPSMKQRVTKYVPDIPRVHVGDYA